MCPPHWYSLPEDMRREIWRLYRPGQEIDKSPSLAYLEAATRAQQYVKRLEDEKRARAGLQKDLFA